jgi:hypothetical protein
VNSGPVTSVNMPKDRITGTHQGFGFIEFMSEEDADYAIKIMNMIKLFGKPIKGLFLNRLYNSELMEFRPTPHLFAKILFIFLIEVRESEVRQY